MPKCKRKHCQHPNEFLSQIKLSCPAIITSHGSRPPCVVLCSRAHRVRATTHKHLNSHRSRAGIPKLTHKDQVQFATSPGRYSGSLLGASTLLDWWLLERAALPQAIRRSFDSLVLLVTWLLWKERNRHTFDHISP